MLNVRENERLTRVGPGTPMGELMRRYWHPIATTSKLVDEPVRAIKILCESLVLYRDRGGTLGLIQESCPHRRVNLLYGIPEQTGLRCPYHGWLFDETGRCLEQPAEAPDSTFKDRVSVVAYPVQELGGLIWAYLGPAPAPLLPRWDLFVQDGLFRDMLGVVLPCNWLQVMENTLDPVHLEQLHGRYFQYLYDRGRVTEAENQTARRFRQHHAKIGFDVFEYGIIKRRLLVGQTEEDEDWRIGHPLVFPYTLRQGGANRSEFHIRVPLDDTHTWHLWYICYDFGAEVELRSQDPVPYTEVPVYGPDGDFLVDYTEGQDIMTWVTQGEIADRSVEKLAESDKGLILYRRLLQEQMEKVAEGVDPMGVIRDPEKNVMLTLAHEKNRYNQGPQWAAQTANIGVTKYSPQQGQILEVLGRAAQAAEKAGQ
jgi:5,5'-dehydrodivanillate O-demethylase